MGLQENKSIVQGFYDQWNSGAIDFERLIHPNITNHQPDRKPEIGLDRFRQAIEGVMGAVPDSSWTTLRLVAEEDLVVCHNRWSGTYGGTVFRGVTVQQGKRFSVEHVHICRISDDRIVEHWVVRDDLGMVQQTGAISNPE
jgi:predicted ester cyclase